jgi:hypothetical protein
MHMHIPYWTVFHKQKASNGPQHQSSNQKVKHTTQEDCGTKTVAIHRTITQPASLLEDCIPQDNSITESSTPPLWLSLAAVYAIVGQR